MVSRREHGHGHKMIDLLQGELFKQHKLLILNTVRVGGINHKDRAEVRSHLPKNGLDFVAKKWTTFCAPYTALCATHTAPSTLP